MTKSPFELSTGCVWKDKTRQTSSSHNVFINRRWNQNSITGMIEGRGLWMICRRREAGVGAKQCPGSQFTRSRLGRWRPHHPCFNLHSVLLPTSTSNYPSAAHCVGSHLSPPSPSPRTFRQPRGRRPCAARGLLQRPGKLVEIQSSSSLPLGFFRAKRWDAIAETLLMSRIPPPLAFESKRETVEC